MEMNLRQFKRAVQIFDDALNDSIASTTVDIYDAYASYCQDRYDLFLIPDICHLLLIYFLYLHGMILYCSGKLGNAQKVFIRGLCATDKLSKTALLHLWNQFLLMMKANAAPAEQELLTLETLYDSVKLHFRAESEHISSPASLIHAISQEPSSTHTHASTGTSTGTGTSLPTSNTPGTTLDSRMQDNSQYNSGTQFASPSKSVDASSSSRVVMMNDENGIAESKESDIHELFVSDSNRLQNQINTENIDQSQHQQQQLQTQLPDQLDLQTQHLPVFIDEFDDVTMYTPEELRVIYHDRPPVLFTTPELEPMKSGFMLLTELEITSLEFHFSSKFPGSPAPFCSPFLAYCLDQIESLWTIQSLKERHFDSWFADLRNSHAKEEKKLLTSIPGDTIEMKINSVRNVVTVLCSLFSVLCIVLCML